MTGLALKDILTSLDESLACVARRLNTTPQNLDSILKTKDIKTGLIERLSKIYNMPISFFFDEKTATTNHISAKGENNGILFAGDNNSGDICCVPASIVNERIAHLEEMLAEKNERIKELKERIEELKEK